MIKRTDAKIITILVGFILLITVVPSTFAQITTTDLYTCDNPNDGGNQIHKINQTDGTIISSQNIAVTLSSGDLKGCLGISVDPTDAQMYIIARNTDATQLRYIVSIDPTTGVGTEVGEFLPTTPIVNYLGLTPQFLAKTIHFDSSGQMFVTHSQDPQSVEDDIYKVDKTTGIVDTENIFCTFTGSNNDFVFMTLNYDDDKVFYIDGDAEDIFFGFVNATGVGGSCDGGIAGQTLSDNFPHLPFLNFQMGMAYDTVTTEYFIQDNFEEPQSISRMNSTGNSTAVGTSITDGLQRGMAFTLSLGVSDTTPPVISLLQSEPIELGANTSFDDLDFVQCIDDTDGDISGSMVITGDTVDTSDSGSYFVNYSCTDSASNERTLIMVHYVVNREGSSGNGGSINTSIPAPLSSPRTTQPSDRGTPLLSLTGDGEGRSLDDFFSLLSNLFQRGLDSETGQIVEQRVDEQVDRATESVRQEVSDQVQLTTDSIADFFTNLFRSFFG